jgi:hypothetical protein
MDVSHDAIVIDHRSDRDGQRINERLSGLKLSRYMDANEPSSANGTITANERRPEIAEEQHITSTTSTIVSINVNSTSSTRRGWWWCDQS